MTTEPILTGGPRGRMHLPPAASLRTSGPCQQAAAQREGSLHRMPKLALDYKAILAEQLHRFAEQARSGRCIEAVIRLEAAG